MQQQRTEVSMKLGCFVIKSSVFLQLFSFGGKCVCVSSNAVVGAASQHIVFENK